MLLDCAQKPDYTPPAKKLHAEEDQGPQLTLHILQMARLQMTSVYSQLCRRADT